MHTGCHYLISLSACVCVTFVVFTDCESCTRPTSTNSGSMEEGEYGLTRGTCFVARRLEVVAVARLLWISWCVVGAAGFRGGGFVYFSSNAHTRPAASMRPPCVTYLSTSYEARTRERSDRGHLLPIVSKKVSSYRGAYRVPLFN